MIPLGLSSAELRTFHQMLVSHHQIRVRVSLQTLSGTPDVTLTGLLMDGQVNVDQTADVTRSLTLSLFDERRSLPFDSDSPASSALFMDRMMRAVYDVRVGDEWQPVPVFTGPITKLDRDGMVVNVEAQGKETLAMAACWRPLTIRKGTRKTDAIKTILGERAGETQFSIPDLSARMPRALSLHRDAVPWVEAKKIAHSMNRQLFYDGDGTCRLRTWPGTAHYTFGDNNILNPMQVSYSNVTVNTVLVTGATPKGKKTPLTWTAVAPSNHPLSPWRLGRNGVPRHLLETISNDHLRSTAECKAAAEHRLGEVLRQQVQVTFDALPIPHLDPGDIVHADDGNGAVTLRLAQFSLPLVVGDNASMSVGQTRNVTVKKRRRHK